MPTSPKTCTFSPCVLQSRVSDSENLGSVLHFLRTYLTAHITNVADEYDQPMAVFELAMDMLGA